MHWNIYRLANKINEVETYVDSFDGTLHVIIISETWVTPLTSQIVNLFGYEHIHNYRDDKEGGGLCIFLHQSLCTGNPIEVLVNEVTPDFNHFLVIKVPMTTRSIAVAYRRPLSNVTVFLDQLIQNCMGRTDCILFGDFNLNILDVGKHDLLNSVLEPNGYMILNGIDLTFTTRRASGTILGLAITNKLDSEYLLSVIHHQASGHSILFVSTHDCITAIRPNAAYRPKFKINDAVVKTSELMESKIFTCGNELNLALSGIVSECTSEVRVKSNQRIKRPHVDRDLVLAIRERDRLFHLKTLYPFNDLLRLQHEEKSEYGKNKRRTLRSSYMSVRDLTTQQVILRKYGIYIRKLFLIGKRQRKI